MHRAEGGKAKDVIVLCQSMPAVARFKGNKGGGPLSKEQHDALGRIVSTAGHGYCLEGVYNTGKDAVVRALAGSSVRVYTIWSYLKMKPEGDMGDDMETLRPIDASNIVDIKWIVLMDYTLVEGRYLQILDHVLRKFRQSSVPFGGTKLLFVGDSVPCCPLEDDHITKHATFRALTLGHTELTPIALLDEDDEQYRQLVLDVSLIG